MTAMHDHPFASICGVDFSGARLAGRTTWVARIERAARPVLYRLTRLASLETLCGTADRGPVLAHLVQMIRDSEETLWALGFPFGLPMEVVDGTEAAGWRAQLEFLRSWGEDAYGVGVDCLRRAQAQGHKGHIRRLTDIEMKAPWDTYAYRIIYQTFYGMRDVLGPLRGETQAPSTGMVQETRAAYGTEGTETGGETAVLPFDYARLPRARRVVVEACPASTLKRLGLPHQNYKQPGAAPLTPERRKTRRVILAGLGENVAIGRVQRQILMRDTGGDALDAVIAAVGAALSWRETDHRAVAAHPRYRQEGRHYA
ncbi:MAG: DUF429 domain-containing protein [Armatimonadetes bacterium]|nr:DUF429 domain-containing protein [Armatimonadota bacterium]